MVLPAKRHRAEVGPMVQRIHWMMTLWVSQTLSLWVNPFLNNILTLALKPQQQKPTECYQLLPKLPKRSPLVILGPLHELSSHPAP